MVGRPREFDVEDVLDAAMQAFWAKGYEATSLTDLVAATGLLKGSLYQAFGDKHSLFLQSLNRYLEAMHRQKNEILQQAATPLEGIQNVLHRLIDMVDGDSACPKGCMAINTLIELAPHDRKVQQIMDDHIGNMRKSMEKTVQQAQAAGQIGSDRSPEVLAALLLTFMVGLTTSLKGPLTKAEAHSLVDAQLDALI